MVKENIMAKSKQEKLEEFFEEDFLAEEEVVEIVEKPKKKSEPVRMKATVVRAYMFSLPDLTSRSVAAISFGNIVTLEEPEDFSEDFFKVRVARAEGPVEGFVLKNKVKRL
jgi:hypothetical protein